MNSEWETGVPYIRNFSVNHVWGGLTVVPPVIPFQIPNPSVTSMIKIKYLKDYLISIIQQMVSKAWYV